MSAVFVGQGNALQRNAAGGPAAAAEKALSPGSRLAWLDALRGFAALCVVFHHASYLVLQPVGRLMYHWVDTGQYGVFVFFLVSGYIVPASLERKGNVRAFWISRAFRLYPMYALAVLAAVLAYYAGYGDIAGAQHHSLTSAASSLLMLSNILSGPNVPNVAWTLSYEMVFYLLLAALFSWRIHRPSDRYALGFAIAAVALGGVLPMAAVCRAVGGASGVLVLDITVDTLIVVGIALAVAGNGNPWLRRIGTTVAGLTGLVLVTVNQGWPDPWSGCTILALMFTGTLIYHAEQGEASWLKAALTGGAVLVLTITAGEWHGAGHGHEWRVDWISSLVLAALTFAAGFAVKNRKIPRPLAWLGLVSYSVYLLHPLVLNAYGSIRRTHGQSGGTQIVLAAGILAVVLVASAVTYYAVEKPMQRLGRAVARKWAGM
jgi:peptidoglycan/LPS O-acetylase OafA/YrhL